MMFFSFKGLIYDNLHSYNIAFFIGGGALVTASTLIFVIYVNQKRKQRYTEMTSPKENWIQPDDTSTNRSNPELMSGSVPQSDPDCGFSNPAYVLTPGVPMSGDDVSVRVCDLQENVSPKDSLSVILAGRAKTPQTEGLGLPVEDNLSTDC